MALILCGLTSAATSQLGSIDFPNSGEEKAQESFVRAVLLLHSFEYEDAREAFVETQALERAPQRRLSVLGAAAARKLIEAS